ncbi:hypothetical protein D3C80_1433300 [compost metagenome]
MRLSAEVVVKTLHRQVFACLILFEFEWTGAYRSSILRALLDVGFILKDMLRNRGYLHQCGFKRRADLRKLELNCQIVHLGSCNRLIVDQEVGAQEAVLLLVQNAVDREYHVISSQLFAIMPGKAILQLQCVSQVVFRRGQAFRQVKGLLAIVHLEQWRVQRLVNSQADTVACVIRIQHLRIGSYPDNQAASIFRFCAGSCFSSRRCLACIVRCCVVSAGACANQKC